MGDDKPSEFAKTKRGSSRRDRKDDMPFESSKRGGSRRDRSDDMPSEFSKTKRQSSRRDGSVKQSGSSMHSTPPPSSKNYTSDDTVHATRGNRKSSRSSHGNLHTEHINPKTIEANKVSKAIVPDIPAPPTRSAVPPRSNSIREMPAISSQAMPQPGFTREFAKALIQRPSLTFRGKVAKHVLIAFNLIFMITGLVFLSMGVWLRVSPDIKSIQNAIFVDTPSEKYIKIAVYVLIAFGLFVMTVSFFGCYGAVKENNCLLSLYVGILVIIFCGEVTIGILAYIFNNQTKHLVKSNIAKIFINEKYQPHGKVAAAWDIIQTKLLCCGVNNYTDYRNVEMWKNNTKKNVPVSCCMPGNHAQCQKEASSNSSSNTSSTDSTQFEYLHSKGCFNTLMGHITSNFAIIMGVVAGVLFIEIMGIMLALCVCRNQRKKLEESHVPPTRT